MFKQIAITMFEKFGFNVLPLRGKRPTVEWDNWQSNKQTLDDITSMPWQNATGLGAVMGIEDLRVIDIDGIEDYDLLDEILSELGLKDKYPWVVQSGSGIGFHIYLRCKDDGRIADVLGGDKSVYKFKLKMEGVCDHIELRWKDCQTALPPSIHESTGIYSYYYSEPEEAPEYIEPEKVLNCIQKLCDITELTATEDTFPQNKQYIDREMLENALDYLSDNLPAGSYEEWYRIGFALVPFGKEGEEYFVKMTLANPHYADTEATIRKKFDELTSKSKGNISPGTIFHIAESYGWKKSVVKFWYLDTKGNVKIARTRFKRFLEAGGFCKYKIDESYLFIRIVNNIVEEIDSITVKDFAIGYLNSLPMDEFDDFNRTDVMDAVIKSTNQIFANSFFEFLITRNIDFQRDTMQSSFIFFENGVVEVNKEGIDFKEYRFLNGNIWKRQILKRRYISVGIRADYEEFLFNVCGKESKRFASLKSAIGYSLHSYKDPNVAKAIIFMDERLSEGAFGRSGKGLLIKAISNIRRVVSIDGRNFLPSKNFAFQRVSADTNIVAFEDLQEKFPFDRLYSITTDGITVEVKHKNEIFIPFPESPKILISTNFSIRGIDDSTVDRQFIIEFSDYYNKRHRPIDDFGKLFFVRWSEEEWGMFDNFMIECLQLYLQKGLIEYEHVNLEQKQLTDETCPEFTEFSWSIQLDHEYNKRELCEQFKREYTDFDKLTQRKFTGWLKKWAKIKNYDVVEGKSQSNRTIIFSTMKKAA